MTPEPTVYSDAYADYFFRNLQERYHVTIPAQWMAECLGTFQQHIRYAYVLGLHGYRADVLRQATQRIEQEAEQLSVGIAHTVESLVNERIQAFLVRVRATHHSAHAREPIGHEDPADELPEMHPHP